ncbi:MAG: hypothetical protein LDL33_07480 [Desulfomonile sp.]|nr:hypothetical protein [Desulfomonile sp.]
MKRLSQPSVNPIIDSPPFCIQEKVRLSETWSALSAVAVGVAVLASWQWLAPGPSRGVPSLTLLLIVSVSSGGCYIAVRFVSYWTARIVVTQTHAPVGRVHPAASGELPRTAFFIVLLAPGIVCALCYTLVANAAAAFGPEFRLAVAVIAGVAVRDVRAAYHVMMLPSSLWFKEKRDGLEALQLLDKKQRT